MLGVAKSMRRSLITVGVAVALVMLAYTSSHATALTFNFDTGIGPQFSVFSTDNLFAVRTSGSDLRISKDADDIRLRSNPNEFIFGGIRSNFALGGDFIATVDFSLNNFPGAPVQSQLNESLMAAISADSIRFVEVLRFRSGPTRDRIELFSVPSGAPAGLMTETTTSGRYRLERTGSTVSASYAIGSGSTFIPVASVLGFSDLFHLQLFAAQGLGSSSAPSRSSTALDISFDNLVVTADTVTGLIPEPSTILIFTLGLALAVFVRRRRGALVGCGRTECWS